LKVDFAIDSINRLTEENDDAGIIEIIADFSDWTFAYVQTRVTAEASGLMNALRKEAA